MSTECGMHTGLHTALMRHVGRGRRFSVAKIAEMTGASKSYVQKWLSGEKVPCALNLMRLFKILGTPFVNAVLRGTKHGGAMPIDDTPACPREAMAASADATAFGASAMADGVIDENERSIWDAKQQHAAQLNRRVRAGRVGAA